MASELKTNEEALDATADVQQRTKDAIYRMQQQTEETQELGENTLSTLKNQRKQTENIHKDAKRMEYELRKTDQALNSFDRWTGKFLGRQKRAAKKEVKASVDAGVVKSSATSSSTGVPTPVPGSNGVVRSRKVVSRRPKAQDVQTAKPVELNHKNEDLTHEENAKMKNIQQNDAKIDDMLGAMDGVLDNLNDLSMQIREEAGAQNKQMDAVTETIDKSNKKQAVVNSRVQKSLVGRWKNRK